MFVQKYSSVLNSSQSDPYDLRLRFASCEPSAGRVLPPDARFSPSMPRTFLSPNVFRRMPSFESPPVWYGPCHQPRLRGGVVHPALDEPFLALAGERLVDVQVPRR